METIQTLPVQAAAEVAGDIPLAEVAGEMTATVVQTQEVAEEVGLRR